VNGDAHFRSCSGVSRGVGGDAGQRVPAVRNCGRVPAIDPPVASDRGSDARIRVVAARETKLHGAYVVSRCWRNERGCASDSRAILGYVDRNGILNDARPRRAEHPRRRGLQPRQIDPGGRTRRNTADRDPDRAESADLHDDSLVRSP